MRLRSIIDGKRKAQVREAMAKGDNSIFGKRKVEIEPVPAKPVKTQLSPAEQDMLNRQLVEGIITQDPGAVRKALEKGADPDTKAEIPLSDEVGTALSLAVCKWSREFNRTIIDKPENWTIKNNRLAAYKEIVELLVTSGADPNVTFCGRPILDFFSFNRTTQDLLIKHGAKV